MVQTERRQSQVVIWGSPQPQKKCSVYRVPIQLEWDKVSTTNFSFNEELTLLKRICKKSILYFENLTKALIIMLKIDSVLFFFGIISVSLAEGSLSFLLYLLQVPQ